MSGYCPECGNTLCICKDIAATSPKLSPESERAMAKADKSLVTKLLLLVDLQAEALDFYAEIGGYTPIRMFSGADSQWHILPGYVENNDKGKRARTALARKDEIMRELGAE